MIFTNSLEIKLRINIFTHILNYNDLIKNVYHRMMSYYSFWMNNGV